MICSLLDLDEFTIQKWEVEDTKIISNMFIYFILNYNFEFYKIFSLKNKDLRRRISTVQLIRNFIIFFCMLLLTIFFLRCPLPPNNF